MAESVEQAGRPEDLEAVRGLVRRFVEWHLDRHAPYRAFVERYFDAAAFEAELAGLPGAYAPPRGSLLIARADGVAAGCVAMRDLGGGVCEMKRMFVAPEHQGRGLGAALGARLVADARAAGYTAMRLDKGPLQPEATALYHRLGFREIEAYYPLPPDMQAFLTFMELDLRPG